MHGFPHHVSFSPLRGSCTCTCEGSLGGLTGCILPCLLYHGASIFPCARTSAASLSTMVLHNMFGEKGHNNGMNADWGIPRGFAALHTPAGYAGRWVAV
jgi:hypothetical protein